MYFTSILMSMIFLCLIIPIKPQVEEEECPIVEQRKARCSENECEPDVGPDRVRDPLNCHVYYQCDDGEYEPFECYPKSWVYNDAIKKCDPVTECGCTEGELVPHPVDCTYFFQCMNGQYEIKACQNGMMWNNRDRICGDECIDA